MQYDRQTVNLILEIKRSLPEGHRDDFKLSSPDLIDKVKDIYQDSNKEATRSLAAKFLELAGIDTRSISRPSRNPVTRLYRGVDTSIEAAQQSKEVLSSAGSKPKATRMYRGQLVQD